MTPLTRGHYLIRLGDSIWPGDVPHTLKTKNFIKLYPNPANDVLFIENAEAGSRVQLFDILGREVFTGVIQSTQYRVNTANFPAGTYILRLTGTTGITTTRKFLKE